MPHTEISNQAAAEPPPKKAAVRWFGSLQLLRLLGTSERSMAWCVMARGDDHEQMLVLPRHQPADDGVQQQWLDGARRAARLDHPQLAPVVDLGVRDRWPYMLHDMRGFSTLADKLSSRGMRGIEAVELMQQALRGLAYAHEAGVAHQDPQLHLLLVNDAGQLRVAGTGVAAPPLPLQVLPTGHTMHSELSVLDTDLLRLHRQAAERDLLAMGVLMHAFITGQLALDEADTGKVLARLPPLGPESLRLPWALEQPLSDPLRAIVNRITDRQPQRRYRSARTLQRALDGWLKADNEAGGGPLALLIDQMRINGALPSTPGAAERAARLALMDKQRTHELAEVVLEDLALSFELLRAVNSARVRGDSVSSTAPVLTVRRAIAMLGLDGVRRGALVLRNWPGPLNAVGAKALRQRINLTRRAARIALSLRPAGYDSEVVYLVTVLQDLGRLMVQYHFPDEALQIRRLMQPATRTAADMRDDDVMTEQTAAFAVLGVDIEALGTAVARHWELDDSLVTMIRRLPLTTPVHRPGNDDDILRTLASCGHEAVEALMLPAAQVNGGLRQVLQRYGPALGFGAQELQQALQDKPDQRIAQESASMPLDALPTEV